MSVFSYTAPLFKWAGRRWSGADFRAAADTLRPFVGGDRPILDLGGGTGELGAGVAAVLGVPVVVADATPQMLARVSPHPGVTVRLARAEELPFPTGHFDALLCCDAFHHFRDQSAAVREMARVVRPGGGVVVMDMQPTGWVHAAALLERLVGEPSAFLTPSAITELMAEHGIIGGVQPGRMSTYSFLGAVRSNTVG